ncbi:beta-ketoacyl-[acyl-carrier-protein] synthase II [Comamonas serinivorans]|uniref:Beta-ketoacyl-[acyl-carrier-protein] synthase II n=1 Tax=Comamonas serinivorans TaxID=1082851 RepID=A0A1Y0EMU5_9BURK|nr:beta-ketoacyl-[acyl-carrier-protein] synthase family protein [Comamonas serinivorans]ARU04984.1 beta-ketoacyl-[acyl-carrier-protein] synthase II [Comamonas serinivorans]
MARVIAYTATSAVGQGRKALLDALMQGRSGLQPCDFPQAEIATWIGAVEGLEAVTLPAELAPWDCRNNRLAWLGLQADGLHAAVQQAVQALGSARVGLILGTSTSGILSAEQAYQHRAPDSGALPAWFDYRRTHDTAALSGFVAAVHGLTGPALTISTACSSSAKAFAAADRWLQQGVVDAVLVGGVDSLCLTTLYGFSSLELTSSQPCRPGDAHRDGLSIGEAAAFALLMRDGEDLAGVKASGMRLAGWGESSDAHHMSAPHPEGLGARMAMQAALRSAGLSAGDIDYINLHGTATPANDQAEGAAVAAVLGTAVNCSSTKGLTGHTLGAAGGLEAVVCLLALEQGLVPATVGLQQPDPGIALKPALRSRRMPVRHAMSNSFGFGGSNCSLIVSREAA